METPEKLVKNIRFLLKMLAGDPVPCRGCGKEIWFIEHPRTHTMMPITEEALNHHADCPYAKDKPWKQQQPGA
jgi:hypothetical protein